jgi:hypothetical protein
MLRELLKFNFIHNSFFGTNTDPDNNELEQPTSLNYTIQ